MLACATLSSLPPQRGGNEKRTGTGVEKKAFSCDNVPLRLESAYRLGRIAVSDVANGKSWMKRLLELAKKRFHDDWTAADERLFEQTAMGEVADYGDGDPAEADKWGDKRVLRANRIEWLCTDREAIKAVTHKGVQTKGARIEGALNLTCAKIEFPLAIGHSAIPCGMVMQRCELYALFLTGTHTGPITADELRVEHGLHMSKGFHPKGDVRLPSSRWAFRDGDSDDLQEPERLEECAEEVH